jgi:ribosomal protein L44E
MDKIPLPSPCPDCGEKQLAIVEMNMATSKISLRVECGKCKKTVPLTGEWPTP